MAREKTIIKTGVSPASGRWPKRAKESSSDSSSESSDDEITTKKTTAPIKPATKVLPTKIVASQAAKVQQHPKTKFQPKRAKESKYSSDLSSTEEDEIATEKSVALIVAAPKALPVKVAAPTPAKPQPQLLKSKSQITSKPPAKRAKASSSDSSSDSSDDEPATKKSAQPVAKSMPVKSALPQSAKTQPPAKQQSAKQQPAKQQPISNGVMVDQKDDPIPAAKASPSINIAGSMKPPTTTVSTNFESPCPHCGKKLEINLNIA